MNQDLLRESLVSARTTTPIVPPAAPAQPLPTAGASLSAMERAVPEYRKKVSGGAGGSSRGAHRVDGFRDGWQAAMEFVRRMQGERR